MIELSRAAHRGQRVTKALRNWYYNCRRNNAYANSQGVAQTVAKRVDLLIESQLAARG